MSSMTYLQGERPYRGAQEEEEVKRRSSTCSQYPPYHASREGVALRRVLADVGRRHPPRGDNVAAVPCRAAAQARGAGLCEGQRGHAAAPSRIAAAAVCLAAAAVCIAAAAAVTVTNRWCLAIGA